MRKAGFFSALPIKMPKAEVGKWFEISILFSVRADKSLILHKAMNKKAIGAHPCKILVCYRCPRVSILGANSALTQY